MSISSDLKKLEKDIDEVKCLETTIERKVSSVSESIERSKKRLNALKKDAGKCDDLKKRFEKRREELMWVDKQFQPFQKTYDALLESSYDIEVGCSMLLQMKKVDSLEKEALHTLVDECNMWLERLDRYIYKLENLKLCIDTSLHDESKRLESDVKCELENMESYLECIKIVRVNSENRIEQLNKIEEERRSKSVIARAKRTGERIKQKKKKKKKAFSWVYRPFTSVLQKFRKK